MMAASRAGEGSASVDPVESRFLIAFDANVAEAETYLHNPVQAGIIVRKFLEKVPNRKGLDVAFLAAEIVTGHSQLLCPEL